MTTQFTVDKELQMYPVAPGNSPTMTSREIAELTGKDLGNVHRDIRSMIDELKNDDSDLNHPTEDKDARGYTVCFHLDRELTDVLLLGYSAVARRNVIRRWRELEAGIRVPSSFAEALLLAADLEQQKERLKQQILLDAPKVEFADAVVQQAEEMSLTAAWKHFNLANTKRQQFIDLLVAGGAVIRRKYFDGRPDFIEATAPMVRGGYFTVREVPDERGVPRKQTLVTGKGLGHIYQVLKADGVLGARGAA